MEALNQILARSRGLKCADAFPALCRLPGGLRDRILGIDTYFSPGRDQWRMAEKVLTQAYANGRPGDQYSITLLLNSSATTQLEVSHGGVGRFLRSNQPGNLVFMDMSVLERLQGASGGLLHSLTFAIDKEKLHNRFREMLDEEVPSLEPLLSQAFRDDGLEMLLKRLWQHCQTLNQAAVDVAAADLEAEQIADRIYARLVALTGRKTPDIASQDTLRPQSILRVIDYIEDHLQGDLSRDELALLAGVSAGHFSMLFTQTVGVPCKRYILQRRVERIKERIRSGGHESSLAELASTYRFSDQAHLSREFKRQVGVSPRDFRLGISR